MVGNFPTGLEGERNSELVSLYNNMLTNDLGKQTTIYGYL